MRSHLQLYKQHKQRNGCFVALGIGFDHCGVRSTGVVCAAPVLPGLMPGYLADVRQISLGD